MQIKKNDKLRECYYEITHPQGLKILLYPKMDFTKTYAIIATKYGSINNEFIINGNEKVSVPAGIAHFLEHKLFEGKTENAFEQYAKTGADANAYTSFDKTAYLFSTSQNFLESLKILLNFVQNPYFTKENVEKEQGIIAQEISMYEDLADFRIFFNMLNLAYHNHPVKIDIAGSKESILQITKAKLDLCYSSFYQQSELVLCITGKFDIDETINVINSCIIEKENAQNIERVFPDEPPTIFKKTDTLNLSVSTTQFMIGIKDTAKFRTGSNFLNTMVQTKIILEALCGKSSSFYLKCYKDGLINDTFSYEYFCSESFGISLFSSQCKNPTEFYDELFKNVESLKASKISKECFEMCKKNVYGQFIRKFNSTDNLANEMILCYFNNSNIYEMMDAYTNVTLDDVNNRLLEHFNEQNAVISIVNPK